MHRENPLKKRRRRRKNMMRMNLDTDRNHHLLPLRRQIQHLCVNKTRMSESTVKILDNNSYFNSDSTPQKFRFIKGNMKWSAVSRWTWLSALKPPAEIDDGYKLHALYEKFMATDAAADALSEEREGHVVWLRGGNNRRHFPWSKVSRPTA